MNINFQIIGACTECSHIFCNMLCIRAIWKISRLWVSNFLLLHNNNSIILFTGYARLLSCSNIRVYVVVRCVTVVWIISVRYIPFMAMTTWKRRNKLLPPIQTICHVVNLTSVTIRLVDMKLIRPQCCNEHFVAKLKCRVLLYICN